MVLGALLDSTVSICIEQLAQVLDLAANLGASIGVAHHAATVCLVKTVGLALDVHVARECSATVVKARCDLRRQPRELEMSV